jgi:predicted nucleic acid-binding protein
MRSVFADTCYWIAMVSPRDQLNIAARKISKTLTDCQIVTTDAVLIELLNYFAEDGEHLRKIASQVVFSIQQDPNVTVLEQTRVVLQEGIELYSSRLDKGYSLTDCISMVSMRHEQINEVLTDDRHFRQERFVTLLPDG